MIFAFNVYVYSLRFPLLISLSVIRKCLALKLSYFRIKALKEKPRSECKKLFVGGKFGFPPTLFKLGCNVMETKKCGNVKKIFNTFIVDFATGTNAYKELKSVTERLAFLADIIRAGSSDPQEHGYRKEFYALLGEYIEYFWE